MAQNAEKGKLATILSDDNYQTWYTTYKNVMIRSPYFVRILRACKALGATHYSTDPRNLTHTSMQGKI